MFLVNELRKQKEWSDKISPVTASIFLLKGLIYSDEYLILLPYSPLPFIEHWPAKFTFSSSSECLVGTGQ